MYSKTVLVRLMTSHVSVHFRHVSQVLFISARVKLFFNEHNITECNFKKVNSLFWFYGEFKKSVSEHSHLMRMHFNAALKRHSKCTHLRSLKAQPYRDFWPWGCWRCSTLKVFWRHSRITVVQDCHRPLCDESMLDVMSSTKMYSNVYMLAFHLE